MNKRVANTVILCVAFMALVVGLSVHRILSPANMSREQLSENGLFLYEVPRRIQDFELVDQGGEAFTRQDLQGHWTLVFFGYTFCPDICPTTMATLSRFTGMLQETDYGQDTKVAMVSVDPRRDTPAKLKQYVGYFDEDFTGLTGEYIDIFNLARQLNVAFNYLPGESEEDYLVSHSGEILLINPNGHFHGFFKVPHQPDTMVENYEVARAKW